MRWKWFAGALAGSGLVAAALAFIPARTTGALQEAEPAKGDGPLPIKQVVLFNSGVGYFQREGNVEGDSKVDLSFPTSDINDLLKSLVLQDLGGGKIGAVSYDSHDPIDKILRSFALDLNNNPTFGQILNQARGEKIEVALAAKKDGQPTKIVGTIVGMETKKRPAGKDAPAADVEILNLSGAQGLQSISLDDVSGVKFLNARLDNEFQRALQVLASSHDTQKKTVNLNFAGAGKRAVRVGYVVERPIWKTTYRLRVDPNGKIFIQGWALVENTSDDDWNDVRMVLVSGRPISFQMNLYEPLYIPRPMVEPEMFASLRPPVYSGAMDPTAKDAREMDRLRNVPGAGGFAPMDQMQQLLQKRDELNRFQGQAINNNLGQQINAQNKLTYEELQRRRQVEVAAKGEAKKAGAAIAMNFKEGIQSVASAEEVGDYYQYVLDQRITLSRQKSAMLPILDQTIDGAKVSIFNESVHSKHPLLGLKLKNTSAQPFTQGPITVYDGGVYAGDTRILDVQPGESRLLSYALDQGTEVTSKTKETPSPDMNFRIGESNLTAHFKVRQTKTYTIRNRSTHDRVVVLEHPVRTGWDLVEPKKASEQTRNMFRFQVTVASGKTETFDVVEEQARTENQNLPWGQPQHVSSTGITIKAQTHVSEEKLLNVRIDKGLLITNRKVRESKTYFVQNLSDVDRTFTVDHIVPAPWVRLEDGKEVQRGPEVFRFKLVVAKDKVGQKEVVEEKTWQTPGTLVKNLSENQIREYLASPIPSADVKTALNKALTLNGKVGEANKSLGEFTAQLKAISDDQGRLRANLQIIPQSSEHYKKFLEKFVAQESEIETLQRQIRQAQATLQSLQREYDLYLAELKAD